MNRKSIMRGVVLSGGGVAAAAAAVILIAFGGGQQVGAAGAGTDQSENEAPEQKEGPHGGRLLESDDGFALEITIYEPGIPPQSRVFAYDDGAPISPARVELLLELHRFDRIDTINYSSKSEFLFGDRVVEEPHSFDVKVRATYEGKKYAWEYSSYEGRVEISAESAELSGIALEKVEPRRLVERIPVLGRVGLDQDTVHHVSARYPGAVLALKKHLGDSVKKGETLGVILGTESLSQFWVRAPGSGRVVERRVTIGEVVDAGEVMFVIADLSTVWVDFTVYREDATRVAPGQRVRILPGDGAGAIESTLTYLAPLGHTPSQSILARAAVPNPDGRLRPGLFVKGEIEIDIIDAAMAVRLEALQTFRDWEVVFRNRNTLYEIAIVELGVVDGDFVQVLSGLSPGDTYVTRNSFIVKADIGKSGASHDH